MNSESSARELPVSGPGPREYPTLRKTGTVLLWVVAVFTAAYYRHDVLPMAISTLWPFLGLLVVGFVLGVILRRTRFVPCFLAWWAVLMAAMVRRSSLSGIPLGSQIFDGALLGYPDWSLRFAQALRLGVYFWALWLGAKLAHRIRRPSTAASS